MWSHAEALPDRGRVSAVPLRIQKVPVGFKFAGIDLLEVVGDLTGLRVGVERENVTPFRVDVTVLAVPFRLIDNLPEG
jgi:hypothetical protein